MITQHLFSNATSPLREAPHWGSLRARARARANPKRQIEVTMFAAGVETLEGLKAGKLIEQ